VSRYWSFSREGDKVKLVNAEKMKDGHDAVPTSTVGELRIIRVIDSLTLPTLYNIDKTKV